MKKFIQSFNDKKFKYGSYSAVSAVIVIAVLIVINLVVGQLDLKFDLTDTKIYTISDKSKEVINGINDEINIYILSKTGSEEEVITEIANQYAANSSKINVILKDPYLYPQFVEKYSENSGNVQLNSIIVECGDKFKLIPASDLMTYDYDYTTGAANPVSLDVEPQLTAALQFVTMENVPVVYYVTGHNEMPIPENLTKSLDASNYEIKSIDLMTEAIPEDCAAIIITTPQLDYSPDEADAVKNYLANEGRALVALNYSASATENLNSIINAYGIQTDNAIIVDADSSYIFQNNPTWIIPRSSGHEAMTDIDSGGYRMIFPLAQSLSQTQLKKNSITIEPLLESSNKSYSKNNPESQSVNKEENDAVGPFVMAAAITDDTYTDKQRTTKLVVIGSSDFLIDSVDSYVSGTNSNMALSCIKWLSDNEASVTISPKSLQTDSIIVDSMSAIKITIVCCAVIPICLFAAGFIVFIRRRNK